MTATQPLTTLRPKDRVIQRRNGYFAAFLTVTANDGHTITAKAFLKHRYFSAKTGCEIGDATATIHRMEAK